MRRSFTFLQPGQLIDDDLELVLVKKCRANKKKKYVPAYWFEMRNAKTHKRIGDITLRIGFNANIKYGGNIGYGVDETYRGNHYAARGCLLLFPFAKQHGMKTLWITCNPENIPSRKTCERIGGELVEIVDLPKNNEQYKKGERGKCRYLFEL